MEYKAIIEAFLDLLKDFLKLVLGDEKYAEVEEDVNDIFGE